MKRMLKRLGFESRRDRRRAKQMKMLGAAGIAAAGVLALNTLPDLMRYVKMKRM